MAPASKTAEAAVNGWHTAYFHEPVKHELVDNGKTLDTDALAGAEPETFGAIATDNIAAMLLVALESELKQESLRSGSLAGIEHPDHMSMVGTPKDALELGYYGLGVQIWL